MPDSLSRRLAAMIRADAPAMARLSAVRALGLPDWAIGAGFVRNLVWDRLSGHDTPSPLPDIDVLFHDLADLSTDREQALEAVLAARLPGPLWQVRNQARMHLRKGDPPYGSTLGAMARWLETPTAVAVRLGPGGTIEVLAPFGLADLFAMICRPTPAGRRHRDEYDARVRQKNWQARWPALRYAA